MSWGAPSYDASELAQDTLADAHLNLTTCRGDVTDPFVFGRWLRGIARNKYLVWVRSRSRRERLAVMTPPDYLEQIASPATAIASDQSHERLVRLRAEIQRLPAKYREVIMMHYLDETPVADIAALLSISAKAVEGRLYQARKTLRKRMDESTSWSQVAKAVLL